MRFLFTAALLVLTAAPASPQTIRTAALDTLFNRLERQGGMLGSVAIAKGGVVVYQRSVGVADIATDIPATDTTRYRIGSITKTFTAVLIYQLIGEGRLGLDTPLARYFPAIPGADRITIKMMLAHRSGLYDFVNDTKGVDWLRHPHTAEEILEIICRKPNAAPDERFAYSNSAYWLLARIVERITGRSYADGVRIRICEPLGLNHTTAAGAGTPPGEALPYSRTRGTWKPVKDFYFGNVSGVGDILSTPADLARLDAILISGTGLRKESRDTMMAVADTPFGKGIMYYRFADRSGWGHGGDTYGTHSLVLHFPADSLTMALCLNGEEYPRRGIVSTVLGILFGESYVVPGFDAPLRSTAGNPRYAGVWTGPGYPRPLAISCRRRALFMEPAGGPRLELDALAPDAFVTKARTGIFIGFLPDGRLLLSSGRGTYFLQQAR